MGYSWTLANRQASLNNFITALGANAMIAWFDGVMPTNVDTAYSGNTIIGADGMAATPYGAPSAAAPSVATGGAVTQNNAYKTSTATFFRSFTRGTAGITGAGFVVGNVYMVQAIGSSTLANFQAIGLSAGITTLAVGQMFIATGTTLTGSGTAYLMNPEDQGDCGSGSGTCNMNTTSVVAGGPIQVNSITISM